MVSIRRRRLLGLCAGNQVKICKIKYEAIKNWRIDLLDPLSQAFAHEKTPVTSVENTGSVSVHPLHLKDAYKPKEETSLEPSDDSPHVSASSPSKDRSFQQFPEVKRRKRHRRKHVENQEACTMRGVYFKNRKWQAAIKVDKKQIHLGTVNSEEEAARLYDRAAFMCGREPNFELTEEEKLELRKYNWDEFLAVTRSVITNKKVQRRRKPQKNDSESEHRFSASEDDTLPAHD